ncbi:MAG: hypothetical protein LBB64_03800, partial [Dysgonamonadaceae bacterium]|nr:hypothetical protein [Dysgonamonadaceae bacterium]
MKPNLTAGLESCLQRLTGYLANYTGQYPELTLYSFSYENGQWVAVFHPPVPQPAEGYYERNLKKLLDYVEQHYEMEIPESFA